MDCSLPGSSIHEVFQARVLERVAMKMKSLSRVQLFATPWTAAYQAPLTMQFPRQEYWSGLPLLSLGWIGEGGYNVSRAVSDIITLNYIFILSSRINTKTVVSINSCSFNLF